MKGQKIPAELENLLLDFGLTDKEASLYIALLKTGPNTIMNLARESGIKRSTTHNNVEELIKKGLVSQTNYGERRMVVAEDPEKLKFLIEQQKWKVKKIEDSLSDTIAMINKLVPEGKDRSKVEVKYYEGEQGFKEVVDRSLEKAENEILFISNPKEFKRVFTEEYDKEYFVPKRMELGIGTRVLIPFSPEQSSFEVPDKKIKRSTRMLPEGVQFDATMIIYSGEVSIMTSSKPYTSILLTGEEIHKTFLSIFEALWAISKGGID